jgi:hypothetical protein
VGWQTHIVTVGGHALGFTDSPLIQAKTVSVHFAANGNTIVFEGGAQRGDLQQPWVLVYAQHLKSKGVDLRGCEFIMPNGARALLLPTSGGGWNWRALDGVFP